MSQHHPAGPKHAPEHALLIDELRDIQSELLDAVQRAEYLLRQSGFDGARLRAEAYWIPHIVCALSRDHGYLGGSMVTMEDTIQEIAEALGEEDENDCSPDPLTETLGEEVDAEIDAKSLE